MSLRDQVESLTVQVGELAREVDRLEALVSRAPPAPAPASADAGKLLGEARQALVSGDVERARSIAADVIKRFPEEQATTSARRMLEEMAIIGTTVGEPGILAWVQGEDRLADHKLTLLVFFEVWCPHCKRELPRLEGLREDWGEQGVGVIGLTSLSRGKTQDEVRAFAASERISYALGHADAQTWERYQVTGVPAIAVIRGNVVVWRGHPASITDEMMRTWLAAP